jgi:hypothetical protein
MEMLLAAVRSDAIGTSRHFAAPQNLVAIGCIADIARAGRLRYRSSPTHMATMITLRY